MVQFVFYIMLVLSLGYAWLLLFYRNAWMAVPVFKKPENSPSNIFISVIVPARNEATNIAALLDSLMNQSYHDFEVIVVNDHSSDETASIVTSFTQSNIRLLQLADFMNEATTTAYKKKAIEVAIAHATGALIVTTDADCVVTKDWLKTIAAYYGKYTPAMIVMPVLIHPATTPLSMFQRLDFMMLQGITAGSVQKKIHSMCNGANLAYRKDVFIQVNGFEGINQIASGDDMLLMEKIKKQWPDQIAYLLSENVIVRTQPAGSVKTFLQQRIRWAGKSKAYQEKGILPVLLFVYLYNSMMLMCLLWWGINGEAWHMNNGSVSWIWIWLVLLGGKMLAELMLLMPVARFYRESKNLFWFPLFQPVHLIYTIIAGTFGMWGDYEWKERKLR